MKNTLISITFILTVSSCIVEIDMTPPYVEVGQIDEYQSSQVVRMVWSGDILLYEEISNQVMADIEFYNSGGLMARNVQADITIVDNYGNNHTTTVYLPDIPAGASTIYTVNTGYAFLSDYQNIQATVFWD